MKVARGDGWELRLGDSGSDDWPEVDHAFADPPYCEHVHKKHRTAAGDHCITDNVELDFRPFDTYDRVLAAVKIKVHVRRWALVFSDDETAHEWQQALAWAGLVHKRLGTWHKPDATPQTTGDRPGAATESIVIAHSPGRSRWNGGGLPGFWSYPSKEGSKRVHPTQKPLALLERLIEQFTDHDDLICDPFAGAASTGVAAIRMGRRWIGWERDPKYFAAACRRLKAARQQVRLPFGTAKHSRARQVQLPEFAAASEGARQ